MHRLLFLPLVLALLWAGSVFGQVKVVPFSEEQYQLLSADDAAFSRIDFPSVITFRLVRPGVAAQISEKRYLGDRLIVMTTEAFRAQRMAERFEIEMAGVLHPDSKISSEFQHEAAVSKAWSADQMVRAWLHYQGDFPQELRNLEGIKILAETKGRVLLEIDRKAAAKVVQWPEIMFLSPEIEERTPLANTALTQNRVNVVHAAAPLGLGMKGEGVNIGVWDFGASGPHRDISAQVVNVENEFFAASGSQHTTVVAGAIAGQGILREEIIGMAPKSNVYVHNFFGDILGEMRNGRQQFGIQVSNHSYNVGGAFQCFTPYNYSFASLLMDEIAIDEPSLTNVFASGNSAAACPFDFRTIAPGFQYAKNVLLVGNIQNSEETDPGSGKGPTFDGRLKPDVVAKGASSFTPRRGIILPSPADNYTNAYGTSFAAPQVSGIAGLLYQAAAQAGLPDPGSATVKALLCNTAKDLGRPGPDYEFGFGRVDALKAIRALQQLQFKEASVSQDEIFTHTVEIGDTVARLKVLLTWNDVPAQLPVQKVLVNDLDLVLEGPDGEVFPLVLNPGDPSAIAAPGVDRLNNTEQIVLDFPGAGSYFLKVIGYDVPEGPQPFSLVWQAEAKGAVITYPLGGEVKFTNAETFVRWDAYLSDTLISVQFSPDNGATWSNIGTENPDRGFISWTIPLNTFSDQALVRLVADSTVLAISQPFSILARPTIAAPQVCRGNVRLSWNNVSGVSTYIVSVLEGLEWKDVAEVNTNSFIFRNAKAGQEYFFAVRSKRAGIESMKSITARVVPRALDCNFSERDLGLTAILPAGGRVGTATAMGANQQIALEVSNFSTQAIGGVSVFYQIDGGEIKSSALIDSIPAANVVSVVFPAAADLSAPGVYIVKAWLQAAADLFPQNDTLVAEIRQAAAVAQGLPYFQGFETLPGLTLNRSSFGLPSLPEWDFIALRNARLRTNSAQIEAIGGDKAITIDNFADTDTSAADLILNIDLTPYRDSLVYLDFSFRSRGELAGNDAVWIRQDPASPWVLVFNLFNNAAPAGIVRNVQRLNLKKILQDAGQNFSAHTQLRFAITNTRSAISLTANGGYTLDNIFLYNPGQDLALASAVFPQVVCLDPATQSGELFIDVQVTNNFPATIPSGQVLLRYEYGAQAYQEFLPLSIDANRTVVYRISKPISFSGFQKGEVDVFIRYEQDRYALNDSIVRRSIAAIGQLPALPLETAFTPQDTLNFLATGRNSSWQLGQPRKNLIYEAADQGEAWVTNLSGTYAGSELSYLYVGCLNFNQITESSQVAMHLIYDLEPGFDFLWMEYSGDGIIWDRLGVQGSAAGAYNWYNVLTGNPRWGGQRPIWQVSSHPVRPSLLRSGLSRLAFRMVLQSDEAVELEGAAIDNFRIIRTADATTRADSVSVTAISSGQGWVHFRAGDSVVAILNDFGQSLGEVRVDIITAPEGVQTNGGQFVFPRRYVFRAEKAFEQPVEWRVFLADEQYLSYLNRDFNVRRMGEVGAIVYSGLNADERTDNNLFSKGYAALNAEEIDFWPYGNGYEIRLPVKNQQMELYLSSLVRHPEALPLVEISDFSVVKDILAPNVLALWTAVRDSLALQYVLQSSTDAQTYTDVATVAAYGNGADTNLYSCVDSSTLKDGLLFYRIKVVGADTVFYTLLDTVSFVNTSVGMQKADHFTLYYAGKGRLMLDYKGAEWPDSQVLLFDIAGRMIASQKRDLLQGMNRFDFPELLRQPAGMYLLQIQSGTSGFAAKFVKSD